MGSRVGNIDPRGSHSSWSKKELNFVELESILIMNVVCSRFQVRQRYKSIALENKGAKGEACS